MLSPQAREEAADGFQHLSTLLRHAPSASGPMFSRKFPPRADHLHEVPISFFALFQWWSKRMKPQVVVDRRGHLEISRKREPAG
jgi:hypothetical protein